MEKLKPCPFCGSNQVAFTPDEDQQIEDITTGFIWCHGCDFSSDSFYSKAVATKKWNRRPATEQPKSWAADTLEKLIPEIEDSMGLVECQRVALRDAVAALRRAASENKRLIDAGTLMEEIQHLQIFLAGESLFTPAIKETVLRTIDEQPTVAAPENKALTLKELREAEGQPLYIVCGVYEDWRIPDFIDTGAYKNFVRFTDRSAEILSDYGKAWLAYARKPGGSTP